jgi:uncharacterized membrane protein
MRKTLVVSGVVQKEVCVQWYKFVSRFEMPRIQWTVQKMVPTDFEVLMNLVGLKIVKRGTRFLAAILVQERLAVTLQFWATGV